MDVHVVAEVYCVSVSISTHTQIQGGTVREMNHSMYVVH